MRPDLSAAFLAELDSLVKRPAFFYEGEFATSTVRFWTGVGQITWDSKEWTGAGQLAGISAIDESGKLKANGITVSISGVPASLLSLVLQEVRQNKSGKVWLAFLTETNEVVADPALAFTGLLDVPTIQDDGNTLAITIAYENKLRDLERPRELRYTNESQQTLFPGDLGFEYVPSLQEWNGVWGRS